MFQVNPLLGRGFTLKNQAIFSLKDRSKKLNCRLLQFLFGTLRVNLPIFLFTSLNEEAFSNGVYNNLLLKGAIFFHLTPRVNPTPAQKVGKYSTVRVTSFQSLLLPFKVHVYPFSLILFIGGFYCSA